jgi:DNA-binding NarL/FixJ family response regulator
MDPRITVIGEASDDCEMVKMSKRLNPDVVLMDLDMHCCDSFEAVSEVSRRKYARTIVALTIHDETTERAAAAQAGVNLFLEKGISSKQLTDAIRRAGTSALILQS